MSIPVSVNKQPIYDAEQAPVLLKLLAEYTQRLRAECNEMGKNRRERDSKSINTAFWLAGYVIVEIILISGYGTLVKTFGLKIFLVVFPIVAGLSLASSAVLLHKSFNDLNNRKRMDVLSTAAQLERLVRRISPIAEHSRLSLGEKLELDLRLADADAALEYAAQHTGKRSRQENAMTRTDVLEASLR